MPDSHNFPCSCCGYLAFDEQPGSYEICPVCGWEDDIVQLRFPTMGGANAPLIKCQDAYAHPPAWNRPLATPEQEGFVRDPDWRPLDPSIDDIDQPRKAVDDGEPLAAGLTVYYYWRDRLQFRSSL
ncbi:CPCC family cysteine-rich protein [Arthrobacter sp. S39]|uniref:CPCC family cysteine-rich protein n=1 Tax=Arthrobacter sp. S39 TaxID=2509720 RepID=UPI001037A191|nr:CPCC family cysteine-rich protein [Arthrobacter sp. S39]TAP43909.1 hydrolase [Arthrobacter sp. S39]